MLCYCDELKDVKHSVPVSKHFRKDHSVRCIDGRELLTIHDTIATVLTLLSVVRHHDKVACNLSLPGPMIMILVKYRPPNTNTEQELPLINLMSCPLALFGSGILVR